VNGKYLFLQTYDPYGVGRGAILSTNISPLRGVNIETFLIYKHIIPTGSGEERFYLQTFHPYGVRKNNAIP